MSDDGGPAVGAGPATFLLKLRSNVELEGDVTLAGREAGVLLGEPVEPVDDLAARAAEHPGLARFRGHAAPGAGLREGSPDGFRARAPLGRLERLVRRASFLQQVYCLLPSGVDADALVEGLASAAGPVASARRAPDGHGDARAAVLAVPHAALLELSDHPARRTDSAAATREALEEMAAELSGRAGGGAAGRLTRDALARKRTTAHLAHGLHYYKAKFFPRLARCLLNLGAAETEAGRAPSGDAGTGGRIREGAGPRVLDPFVGSGTTLVEASALGLPSLGVDRDPLSALISRAKLDLLTVGPEPLAEALATVRSRREGPAGSAGPDGGPGRNGGDAGRTPDGYRGVDALDLAFPDWLRKNRKMTPEREAELKAEIRELRRLAAGIGGPAGRIVRVLVSDAIDRRMKMRVLGTGVGRFSLRFTKTPMPERFVGALERTVRRAAAAAWARRRLGIDFAPGAVAVGDARALPVGRDGAGLVVTSPPYLPAASGRESYAKARALSLIGLGVEDADGVDRLIGTSVGSMRDVEVAPGELEALEEEERDLVAWLADDELRSIKAQPTARYFLDMRRCFAETARALRPGGLAVVVSGKQSTFYEFESREVLREVPAARLLAAEAGRGGLATGELLDVKLKKGNRNARPRSLDDYYETAIFLRAPDPPPGEESTPAASAFAARSGDP